MITIEIADTCSFPCDLPALEAAAAAVFPADGDAVIVLSDENQLHELNQQFLGIDAPTDVLSFPSEETDPETQTRYWGDILISVERAAAQAQAAGHALTDELQLLIVHGGLHLLGFDHADEAEKARMWAEQNRILQRIGCAARAP